MTEDVKIPTEWFVDLVGSGYEPQPVTFRASEGGIENVNEVIFEKIMAPCLEVHIVDRDKNVWSIFWLSGVAAAGHTVVFGVGKLGMSVNQS